MSTASARLSSISLTGKSTTAVVVGATLGIGAAVARLLAQKGCNKVVLVGRNATRGKEVGEKLKELAEGEIEVVFVGGDLSNLAGQKELVDNIGKAVGIEGIDYVFLTQNGLMTGDIQENSDGDDTSFAVQALSRFTLSYLLTIKHFLKPGATVTSIANVGQTMDLDVDDLSLKKVAATGKGRLGMFMMQSQRDSVVIDSFTEELNNRYPQYRYLHCWPGLVQTEQFDASRCPFPVNYGMRIMMMIIVPVALALDPSISDEKYWDYKMKPIKVGAWAGVAENRKALWEKLVEMEEKV